MTNTYMNDTVPMLFLYEYPHMEGTPIGMIEPDAEMLQDPHAMAVWRACVCLFAVEHEECGVHIIGTVFKHAFDDRLSSGLWAPESPPRARDVVIVVSQT